MKKFSICLISILLILGLFLTGCVNTDAAVNEPVVVDDNSEEVVDVGAEDSLEKSPEDEVETVELTDCGDDFSCFILASKDCSEAKVRYVIQTDIFGAIQDTDNSYQLEKSEDGGCVLNFTNNSIDLQYSQDLIDMLKQSGKTQEQIDQQIQESKDNLSSFVGKEGVCEGEKETISALLEQWQAGNLSTSDLDTLECSGSYFEELQN